MKILPKGLIVVGVPLIIGIVFLSSLFLGIAHASRMVLQELSVTDSIITFVTLARCSVCADRYMAVYKSTQDKHWLQRAKVNARRAAAAKARLKAIHESDPSLPIPSVEVKPSTDPSSASPPVVSNSAPRSDQSPELFGPGTGFAKHLAELSKIILGKDQFNLGTISDSTQPLQLLCNERVEDATDAMSSLRAMLLSGSTGELAAAIALTVFFSVSITGRLKKILNNTVSLSDGLELSPPMKGSDEIAELDKFLFLSAQEMRELERFKREMLGVVGGELKNPLNQVGSFLTSLRDGIYGILNKSDAERITVTCSSVQRLIELIGDLFALDRSELRTTPKTVQISELISASIDNVKGLLEQKGLRVTVKNAGGTVLADRDRLIQVIVNLVSNAMKYSPPQGTITIETVNSTDWFECRIIDQGPGIPESFRKQIFEPFKQVDAKDKIAKAGTGLGLTISRRIIEQHGGLIGVDSEPGKGSQFWFKIPLNPAVSASLANGNAAPTKAKIPRVKFSVLKQGLLIISVPLISLLIFVYLLGSMLDQVKAHNDREADSQKILISVNDAGDQLLEATRRAMMYMYTKDSFSKKSFQEDLDQAKSYIESCKKLIPDSPEQAKDIELCLDAFNRFPKNIDKETVRLAAVYSHNPEGSFATMDDFVKLVTNPDHPDQKLIDKIHVLIKDKVHLQTYEPFFDAQDAMERLIERENTTGTALAVQREQLMSILNWTLVSGIVFTTIVSLYLTNYLMRNLIRRLRQVTLNTARIVLREPLPLPDGGYDEIDYLNKVLCETGNGLIELEQFKQSLIGIVSHEIRTPLTAVCITLELLSMGVLGDLPEDGKLRLNVVEEEARDLVRLINDMLDLEKMAAGQFILDKIDFSIVELIEKTSAEVTPLAESKNVKLELDVPVNELVMRADLDRLSRAFTNLLLNRIKSSHDQSTLDVSISRRAAEVEFRVIDHGGGISEELRQKIFDRFVQVENPEARKFAGSGLTLAIAKAIVEQHGGTIGVDSKAGVGTEFWFKLPVSA